MEADVLAAVASTDAADAEAQEVILENQWPTVMGNCQWIVDYCRLRCPVVFGHLAFHDIP